MAAGDRAGRGKHGPLAQLAEQEPFKLLVAGSIPARLTQLSAESGSLKQDGTCFRFFMPFGLLLPL
jgi:hypothetical protein